MKGHTHRCVVSDATPGAVIALSDEESRHLVRVARRSAGDPVEVIDAAGYLWPATVVDVGPPAQVRIGAQPLQAPPTVPLRLVVGLTDNSRIDTVIEKATELGIAEVVIMAGGRSRRIPTPEAFERRRERMVRVAEAAAKQSGRAQLPTIRGIASFDGIVGTADPATTVIVDPTGETGAGPLVRKRMSLGAATVIVGPDVGLDRDEIARARQLGIPVAQLGRAILRTETAALAIAVLAAECVGALGGE